MESKLTKDQIQAWNNFVIALRKHNLIDYCDLLNSKNIIKKDRIIIVCNPQLNSAIQSRCNFKPDKLFLKREHPGAFVSYREDIETYALQICLVNDNGIIRAEVDCDMGRPFWSVKGWLIHAGEVVYNKLLRRSTNPFKVRAAWNKRGFDIPLVGESNA